MRQKLEPLVCVQMYTQDDSVKKLKKAEKRHRKEEAGRWLKYVVVMWIGIALMIVLFCMMHIRKGLRYRASQQPQSESSLHMEL